MTRSIAQIGLQSVAAAIATARIAVSCSAGELTTWRRAAARQRADAGHTFVFGLSDGRVIDGSRSRNSARFLNHACAPNCEAIESGDRVFIHALADIAPGCELFIDYALVVDGCE